MKKNLFNYENEYFKHIEQSRFAKFIAQYEIFKRTLNISGHIAEFGVFKGNSLTRFIILRNMFNKQSSKKIYAYDYFDKFIDKSKNNEKILYNKFVKDSGGVSITLKDLKQSLIKRNLYKNVNLIKGDIFKTFDLFNHKNPRIKYSLVHIDTDLGEVAYFILERIWEKLNFGGIIIFDNYNVFPGETNSVNSFFRKKLKMKKIKIEKFNYSKTPSYIVKKSNIV